MKESAKGRFFEKGNTKNYEEEQILSYNFFSFLEIRSLAITFQSTLSQNPGGT